MYPWGCGFEPPHAESSAAWSSAIHARRRPAAVQRTPSLPTPTKRMCPHRSARATVRGARDRADAPRHSPPPTLRVAAPAHHAGGDHAEKGEDPARALAAAARRRARNLSRDDRVTVDDV